MVRRWDYLPFGEQIASGVGGRSTDYGPGVFPTTPDDVLKKFTGKERDAETGLDYFGARYFSGPQGRFVSADWSARPQPIPNAKLDDPQTVNIYGYVRNNPLRKRDPDGHCCDDDDPGLNDSLAGSPLVGITHSDYAKGGTKIGIGVGLIGTAAVGDAPGGLAGAAMVFSATLGGLSTAMSGLTDILGSAFHTSVSEAQEALSATQNLPGLITTVLSGGNQKAGEVAATLGNVAALASKPKEAVKNLATAGDAAQTVSDAGSLLKSALGAASAFLNPPPPPPPTCASTCPK